MAGVITFQQFIMNTRVPDFITINTYINVNRSHLMHYYMLPHCFYNTKIFLKVVKSQF